MGVLWCPANIASKHKGAKFAGGVLAVKVGGALSTVVAVHWEITVLEVLEDVLGVSPEVWGWWPGW